MIGKVLSLGAVAMDFVLECDLLPRDDGFEVIRKEKLLPGGSASNISVTLAALGVEVYQAGQIGDDKCGIAFRESLREDGVNDSWLVTKKGGTTLHTYIIAASQGQHCIFANLGDCVGTMDPALFPEKLVAGMDCLYVDMFSAEAALRLAAQAKEASVPILYNMQCPPSFMRESGTSRKDIESMLSSCSLFISGKDGYFEMTGEKDSMVAMKQIWEQYQIPEGVIYTAGEKGSFWWDGKKMYHQEAFQIESVDTTGAGDCFTGGLIYSYIVSGFEKQRSLEFASAAAAIKCMQKGPRSKADAAQINGFLADHKKIMHDGGRK